MAFLWTVPAFYLVVQATASGVFLDNGSSSLYPFVSLCLRMILPGFYFLFLTGLLVDRAYRDDARCADKYGKYWKQYCAKVPNLLLPKIF
jgi:protein-S-isoprenylcysteine O-methyltransferase Ste14